MISVHKTTVHGVTRVRLIRARITNYKSIEDSGWVAFDDVTCLVGKNESGKTAFLKALYNLSPIEPENGKFNHILDFPRKELNRYKMKHEKEPAVVVTAEYKLSEDEVHEIESEFGDGVLTSPIVTVKKNYANRQIWELSTDESATIRHLIRLHEGTLNNIDEQSTHTIEDFIMFLQHMSDKPPSVQQLLSQLEEKFQQKSLKDLIISKYLVRYIPRFVYFDDYSIMNGNISIQDLINRRNQGNLEGSDRTFLALLQLAGVSLDDLVNDHNYESLKSSLEAASIQITDDVFEYWTQNNQLEVEFDISDPEPNAPPPLNYGKILRVRIRNLRHRVTVPFDQRSKGFVWFFSFFAYFSQLESDKYNLILLLDEPGLSLHAKAQNDFLRFIDERLSPCHQVIYTTHSPFMIDPAKIDRVRMVQDVDNIGTVVSDDVMKTDNDTIFPLQAALGYELTQTLFIGPNCLLVEGPSDLLYITIMSDYLTEKGKVGLDPRWVITPVGGADKVSTFVSLLGANKLNVAVLLDVAEKNLQRIRTLQENALLKQSSLIKITEFIDAPDGDIEDLFDPAFYLKLVNAAYTRDLHVDITVSDLTYNNPRITKKVEKYFSDHGIAGGKFNHYQPALVFLKEQVTFLQEIDEQTERRWEKLFARINSLLS